MSDALEDAVEVRELVERGMQRAEATERERCAKIVEGDIYKERYRKWRTSEGDRANDGEMVKHCDALAALIRSGGPNKMTDIPLTPKGIVELENRTIECHQLRAEVERLRSKIQWTADRAVLALRGDANEAETLSDINNTLRAALKS